MGWKVSVITIWMFTAVIIVVKTSSEMKLDITDTWKPELGWEVTCTWETLENDTLQSVRLSNEGQQFLIYRPESNGPSKSEVYRTPARIMTVDCGITDPGGRKGQCVLMIEPYQPPTHDFAVECEVSGERPKFRTETKEHIVRALVPPSDAVVVSNLKEEESEARVSLNCSSSGLPPPNLLWTIADDKVQADFTGRHWNATSKLWQVWSFLSYTPTSQAKVVCSPEVNADGQVVKGKPAEFNSADRFASTSVLMTTLFLVLHLLR